MKVSDDLAPGALYGEISRWKASLLGVTVVPPEREDRKLLPVDDGAGDRQLGFGCKDCSRSDKLPRDAVPSFAGRTGKLERAEAQGVITRRCPEASRLRKTCGETPPEDCATGSTAEPDFDVGRLAVLGQTAPRFFGEASSSVSSGISSSSPCRAVDTDTIELRGVCEGSRGEPLQGVSVLCDNGESLWVSLANASLCSLEAPSASLAGSKADLLRGSTPPAPVKSGLGSEIFVAEGAAPAGTRVAAAGKSQAFSEDSRGKGPAATSP